MTDPKHRSVEFEIINEDWNCYRLRNGATIRFKTVLQAIFEHVDTIDEITGLPNYTVRSSNVVSVLPKKVDK
ncbi:hypothetical protein KA005_31970 [bacterium]|nr:hypothetical protein [bacterium]